MYYLALVLLLLLIAPLVLDLRRLRELLPGTLAGTFLSGVPMALPGVQSPYKLLDDGLISGHWPNLYLVQMGIVPVMAAWYIQGTNPAGPLPVKRALHFTLIACCLELAALWAGKIEYASWWNPAYSLLFYLCLHLVTYLIHVRITACGSPHHRVDRSAREVNTPGVLPAPRPADLGGRPLDP